MKAIAARKKLNGLASPEMTVSAARFFKSGPGQYGEGDTFVGVSVPALRKLARYRAGRSNDIVILAGDRFDWFR